MANIAKDFIKFIAEDPLMLGLAISVVLLIIIFILVLCFSGKKKKVEEPKNEISTDNVSDNTANLFKSNIVDSPLQSTQEFNLNFQTSDYKNSNDTDIKPKMEVEMPKIEESTMANEINPTLNSLENTNSIKEPEETPVTEKLDEDKIRLSDIVLKNNSEIKNKEIEEDNVLPNINNSTERVQKTIELPNLDNINSIKNDMPVDEDQAPIPISIEEAINLKNSRKSDEIENTIKIPTIEDVPFDSLDLPKVNSTNNDKIINEPKFSEDSYEDVELPTMKIDTSEVINKREIAEQPFSSVTLNPDDEMPKLEDTFSKTSIIKHIPEEEKATDNGEKPLNIYEQVSSSNQSNKYTDFDLPKLNKDNSNSILSLLTGESFNINK